VSRRAARRALAPLLAAAAALALAACSGGNDATLGYISGPGTVTQVRTADRPAAPDVTGRTVEGGSFDLAAYRGKVVVLNFWASWCPPCRAEGPALQRVAAAMAPQGVVFVGISTRDDDGDAVRAYLRNIASTYPNLDDTDGRLTLLFQSGPVRIPPMAIPSTIVVDRQGRLAARILGPTTQPRLTALLTSIASEPA
jgi:thiol-disulfide isomerase/thioredoxin